VVRFTTCIDKSGGVAGLKLISGHPLLVESAQNAVKQWEYRPTELNGEPIAVLTQVEVGFILPVAESASQPIRLAARFASAEPALQRH
jgi:protein TonB